MATKVPTEILIKNLNNNARSTQNLTLLTQNGFDLSSSPPQVTFYYPSFTHKFIINNLVYFVSRYLQQII
ncbi:1250_t:CDS:2, partial [Diversispora eburnea]